MTSSAAPADAARVAVFAKAPVPGTVKTRLAPRLGAEGAAQLHRMLVRQALATALAARLGPVELWCAPDTAHPFFGECARDCGIALRAQAGPDLGARMHHAFAGGALPALVIGSDCPALGPADLREAAAALAGHDAVLKPAEDGGYVLVGLARLAPEIFAGVAWGGHGVMAQTRARLAQAGLRWRELAVSWDLDRPEDLARMQAQRLLEGTRP